MDATISVLSEALDAANYARDANASLLGQYANALAGMLKQFHEYKQKHVADVVAWHRSYRHQLAEARAENSRLRDQIWLVQERAGRANASLRAFRAAYDADPARWEHRVAEKAVRQELRFWKRLAMPAITEDDAAYWSDDDDLIDPAEKLRLREAERKAAEEQQQQQQQQRHYQQQIQQHQQIQQYEQHVAFSATNAAAEILVAPSSLLNVSGDMGDDISVGTGSRAGNGNGEVESVNLDDLALAKAAAAEIDSGKGRVGSGGSRKAHKKTDAADDRDNGDDDSENHDDEDDEVEDEDEDEDDDDDDDDLDDLDDDPDLEADLPIELLPAVPPAPSSALPPASIRQIGARGIGGGMAAVGLGSSTGTAEIRVLAPRPASLDGGEQ